jgi:hypothetical protein
MSGALRNFKMNAFASIGLGSAISRGSRRTDSVRLLVAQERVAIIARDSRGRRQAAGTHQADASAEATIARLRAMTGAARVIGPNTLSVEAPTMMLGD